VKELGTPTVRISRRSSVLRLASARYVPRSAIHVARSILPRKAKGSFHGLRSFSFASGPAAMPGDNIGCTLMRIMLAKAA
jgi:hypothetical protein